MPLKLNRVSFLIVDDNIHMRKLVRRVLRSMGVEDVAEAINGAEAIGRMRDNIPDVLITDWVMEPFDGIELTRYIRRSPESPNPYMPIIMMTGFAEREKVFQARDAGVTEFLVKPLSAAALFSRIAAIIERPRQFVRVGNYFGPDRRRKKSDWRGDERRGPGPVKFDRPITQEPMSQNEINELFNPK